MLASIKFICILCVLCWIANYWANKDYDGVTTTLPKKKRVYDNQYLNILSTRSNFGKCLAQEIQNVEMPKLDNPNFSHSLGLIKEIFVIHYSKSHARYKFIKSVLQEYNLTARFMTDFDKENITELLACARQTSHKLSNSELSVKIKHMAVYFLVLQKKITHTLILEDDAYVVQDLRETMPTLLSKMMGKLPKYDLFFPGGCWNIKCKEKSEYVCRETASRCSHAYVVSTRGAIKLFFNMHEDHDKLPIDLLMNAEKLIMYWADPVIFLQNHISIEHVKD